MAKPSTKEQQAHFESLPPPEKWAKEVPDFGDGAVPGLRLAIQPSGFKSWVVRYDFQGRDRKYTLGTFAKMDVAEARKRAYADVIGPLHAGTDPQAGKVEERRNAKAKRAGEVTLKAAYDLYLTDYVDDAIKKGKMRPKSKALIESSFKLVWLAKFKNRAIDQITKAEARHAVRNAGDQSHAFTIGRAFFNWCVGEDMLRESPLKDVTAPTTNAPRERVLDDNEIRVFWCAAEKLDYPFGPFLKLLLLTGARRDEVAKMERKELDLDAATWTIPKTRTKNGREHVVHLSDAALWILKSLPTIKSKDKPRFVFTTTGESPVSGYSKAKLHIDKNIAAELDEGDEFEAWIFHDLRRSCATGMGNLGVGVAVIEAALNHVSGTRGGLVGVYQHQTYAAERREAFQKWGNHVTAIVSATPALVPSQDDSSETGQDRRVPV